MLHNVAVIIMSTNESICFTDRMCPCTETNGEGELRLQRALLSHALQVCQLQSVVWSLLSCCEGLTWSLLMAASLCWTFLLDSGVLGRARGKEALVQRQRWLHRHHAGLTFHHWPVICLRESPGGHIVPQLLSLIVLLHHFASLVKLHLYWGKGSCYYFSQWTLESRFLRSWVDSLVNQS